MMCSSSSLIRPDEDAVCILESIGMAPEQLRDDPQFDNEALDVLCEIAERLQLKNCDKAS
jgi:hypothetical protein